MAHRTRAGAGRGALPQSDVQDPIGCGHSGTRRHQEPRTSPTTGSRALVTTSAIGVSPPPIAGISNGTQRLRPTIAPLDTAAAESRCRRCEVVGRQRRPPSRGGPRTGPTGNSGASLAAPAPSPPGRAVNPKRDLPGAVSDLPTGPAASNPADPSRPGALSRTRAALAPQKDLGNPRLHHGRQRQVGAASASEPPTLRDQQGAEQLCLLPCSLSLPGCQRVASAPTPTWRPHGTCKHRSPARVVGR